MTTPSALPDATKLAVDRTRLAHDRTLMAWIRTATSLISFGFTIYKGFQYLAENSVRTSEPLIGPRGYALIMITIGVGALTTATLQHRREMQALRAEYGVQVVPASNATIVAAVIAALGVAGLIVVILGQ